MRGEVILRCVRAHGVQRSGRVWKKKKETRRKILSRRIREEAEKTEKDTVV